MLPDPSLFDETSSESSALTEMPPLPTCSIDLLPGSESSKCPSDKARLSHHMSVMSADKLVKFEEKLETKQSKVILAEDVTELFERGISEV